MYLTVYLLAMFFFFLVVCRKLYITKICFSFFLFLLMSAHKRTYQILNIRSLWNLLNYYRHYNDYASKPVWNWVIHVTVNSRRCSRCIIISIVQAKYLPGYIPSRACFSSHHGKFEDGHHIIIKYRLRIVRRYYNNNNNSTRIKRPSTIYL